MIFQEISGNLGDALFHLREGNYYAAELVSRSILLREGPDWRGALTVLATIAAQCNRAEHLNAFVKAAQVDSIDAVATVLDGQPVPCPTARRRLVDAISSACRAGTASGPISSTPSVVPSWPK